MQLKPNTFLFISEFLNSKQFTVKPITNSASARQYYRIFYNSKSYILTHSNTILENKTFFYFTNKLHEIKIKCPNLLCVSKDNTMYLQEDLGEQNLLNLIHNNANKENILPLLNKCIIDLCTLQTQLPKVLDFTQCYEFQKFDNKVVLNDLFYFKNYYLDYLEIPYRKEKLIIDFFLISSQIETLPHDYFLYRDFQSRNIMINNNTPYYIDYQGGMQGIATYDLVSFSWQAKAQFSDDIKTTLKNNYFNQIKKSSKISPIQLEKSYNLSLILRLYQLLGAYGFRGLVQQKPHFKESINNTLKNIQKILPLLAPYPELKYITQKYLKPN